MCGTRDGGLVQCIQLNPGAQRTNRLSLLISEFLYLYSRCVTVDLILNTQPDERPQIIAAFFSPSQTKVLFLAPSARACTAN